MTRNELLADILAGIKGSLDRLEAAVAVTYREVQALRTDLREEEMARRAVGITVMDHEAKLSSIPGGRGRNGA